MRLDVTSKRLYGRDDEVRILSDLRRNVGRSGDDEQSRRIVWIHGSSGCGKTAICRSALADEAVTDDEKNIFFVEGKYNQLYTSTTAPYSAIVEAFDALGRQVAGYRAEMKECLRFEGTILAKMIPSFGVFLTLDDTANTPTGSDASLMLACERLTVAFRSFLRTFTSRIGPLCIFLDDLHWSDRYSQELSKYCRSVAV